MMSLRYKLLTAVIVAPLCVAQTAQACECFETQPPCAEYWKADAVFVGTVTDISLAADSNEQGFKIQNRSVRFSLEQGYRGVKGSQVELKNWINSCEYKFEVGKKYFVYAYRNKSDNSLGTSGCSRTTEISLATEDLSYIQELSAGKAELTISGSIHDRGIDPVSGVKIVIRGKVESYNSTTDDKGRFRIVVAQPGKYSAQFILPHNSSLLGTEAQLNQFTNPQIASESHILEAEINIEAGRCVFFDVPLFIDREAGQPK